MSITVIVSTKVTDFEKWQAMFDAIENQRVSAGIHATAYRNISDPGSAYVIGTAPSKEAFVEFFSSPERKRIEDSDAVIGKPEVVMLEEA